MNKVKLLKPERRRQARGQQRIESLLKAAETVFSRVGYHEATTNSIAAEASVSPATLYQFFQNKEDMANALVAGYSRKLIEIHASRGVEQLVDLPLPAMVAALIDPMLVFLEESPAFQTLLLQAPLSAEVRNEKHALADKFELFLSQLFKARAPHLSTSQAKWIGQVFFVIYKGFLPDITASSGTNKKKFREALKLVLLEYLKSALSKNGRD
jgi:AcrR family transcriptional regulator